MNLITQKFKIAGMHCTACAMNIDFDLEDLPGITSVRTNYAKQESEVEFDKTQLDAQAIIEAIHKTGYTATPL